VADAAQSFWPLRRLMARIAMGRRLRATLADAFRASRPRFAAPLARSRRRCCSHRTRIGLHRDEQGGYSADEFGEIRHITLSLREINATLTMIAQRG
jgi:hypothetical protein